LEQCNGRVALVIESCKDCRGVELSFYWDVFGIEGMIYEKTISANFSRAWWGCTPQAADTWY